MSRFLRSFSSIPYTRPLRDDQYKVVPPPPIPAHIELPYYAKTKGRAKYCSVFEGDFEIHDEATIQKMRKACHIAAGALQAALDNISKCRTTEDIDKITHNYIISQNAYPSGIHFMGFPKSVCTSVNEVVCHGVPNLRPLEDGDFLNIDVTCYIDGVYGDNSDMALIGTKHPPEVLNLIQVTRQAVREAIKICKPGVKVNKIGETIEEYANSYGFYICKEFTGHGIGTHMHMPPAILPHKNDMKIELRPGMTFTIEPILMTNKDYELNVWSDNWTIVDSTLGYSAQYEHTVLITPDGHEVLTERNSQTSFN